MIEQSQTNRPVVSDIQLVRETLKIPVDGYGLSVALSTGGKYIALGGMVPGQHGLIHLFDNTGKLLWRHKTREAMSCVALCRNGEYLAATSDDGNLYFFDRKGLLSWRHEIPKMFKCLALSETGDLLAAGSEDTNIYYFDRTRPLKKFVWKYKFDGAITCIDISSKGNAVIAGSADRTAGLFDSAGQMLWSHEARDAITAARISSDGGAVALGSADRNVYFFDSNGTALWSHDCGAPVTAIAMSFVGDTLVVAAGSEVRCLSNRGERLWSVLLDSPVVQMTASERAETVLVATEKLSVCLITRPGALAWKYTSSGGIYGMAVSDDSEFALSAGPGEMNMFSNNLLFRELVSRYQNIVIGAKNSGKEMTGPEGLIHQAVTHLGNHNYAGVGECLLDIHNSMTALEKISAERDKLRNDTSEAISGLLITIDEFEDRSHDVTVSISSRSGMPVPTGVAEKEDPRVAGVKEMAAKANLAFKTLKFSEALAIVRRAEEELNAIKRAQGLRLETQQYIDRLETLMEDAHKLEVDVEKPSGILDQARALLKAGHIEQSAALVRDAATALSIAKSGSRKAVEADFTRACKMLENSTTSEMDLQMVEDGVGNAIQYFLEKKDFSGLAQVYERLADCWFRVDPEGGGGRGYYKAMVNAINTYRDAGKIEKSVELAGKMGDWSTAGKLLASTGDKTGAREAWQKAQAAKKPKPQIPEGMKLQAEKYLVQNRYYDAAEELAGGHFLVEASKVLAREQPGIRTASLMLRLMFNLQDIPGLFERARGYLTAVRKEAEESGESKSWANYAHLLVGTLETARMLDAPEEVALSKELREFTVEYSGKLGRDELTPKESCDLALLYTHLDQRNWKGVERLMESRGGPIWDQMKSILGAWKDVNVNLFREEARKLRSLAGQFRYPGQDLENNIPPEDCHSALNQISMYNLPLTIYHLLDMVSSKDYLISVVKHADSEASSGRDEDACLLYEKALASDTFGLLDVKKVHLRLAGTYIAMKKDSEAAPHLEATSQGRDAAVTEHRNLRGIAASAKKPGPGTGAAPAPGGKGACPKCGTPVPARGARCFKCGASLK